MNKRILQYGLIIVAIIGIAGTSMFFLLSKDKNNPAQNNESFIVAPEISSAPDTRKTITIILPRHQIIFNETTDAQENAETLTTEEEKQLADIPSGEYEKTDFSDFKIMNDLLLMMNRRP